MCRNCQPNQFALRQAGLFRISASADWPSKQTAAPACVLLQLHADRPSCTNSLEFDTPEQQLPHIIWCWLLRSRCRIEYRCIVRVVIRYRYIFYMYQTTSLFLCVVAHRMLSLNMHMAYRIPLSLFTCRLYWRHMVAQKSVDIKCFDTTPGGTFAASN